MRTANKLIVATLLLFFSPSFVLANECRALFEQKTNLSETELNIALHELRTLRQQQHSSDKKTAQMGQIFFKMKFLELLKVMPESEIHARMKGLTPAVEKTEQLTFKPNIETDFLLRIAPHLEEAREIWKSFENNMQRKRDSIIYALDNEKPYLIPALVHLGANINSKNLNGETPLTYVAESFMFDTNTLKTLIENGANIHLRNSEKKTPLQIATKNGREEFVDVLFQNGATIDKSTKIHDIIEFKTSLLIVQKYLEQGLNMKTKDTRGNNILHKVASTYENSNIAKYFVQQGIDINSRNANGQTALFLAKDVSMVNILTELGIDVNAKDKNDQTALHQAVLFGYPYHTIEALIKNGADMKVKNNKNLTAFQYAKDKGPEVLKIFKKYGAK